MTVFLLLLAGLFSSGPMPDPGFRLPAPPTQVAPPRYEARFLACAVFAEEVRTTVQARRAMEAWTERGDRFGRLLLSVQPGDGPMPFEAWYDSLEISHDGRSGLVHPDTDGLIGGRWRGTIAAHGEVVLEDRPFMPPELLAVSDLSDALLDFLPPLPVVALPSGGKWTDSLGLEIERLKDSAASSGTAERYRWRITTEGGAQPLGTDSTARLRQTIRDEGVVAWSRQRGPLTWRREIEVEARIDATRGPRSPVQSRVTQTVSVRRIDDLRHCR